jgi:glycosyltransferase 2 family protein
MSDYMQNNTINKKTKILAYLFYLLIISFIGYYLYTLDYNTFTNINFNTAIFVISILIGSLGVMWGAYMWLLLLQGLGAKEIDKTTLLYVYGKSWLGRYIPGTAPWILGKIGFASEQGISKKKLGASSLLEALLQLISTIITSLLLILMSRKFISLPTFAWIILIVGLITCLILVYPKYFNGLLNFVFLKIKKQKLGLENSTNFKLNVKIIFLYSIGTLITAFSLFLVARSVAYISPDSIPYVMGVSTLSGAIGMMAIFVPSGLGVREVTQTALLSVIMPVDQAILISVLSRFWSIFTDLLFFMAVYFLYRFTKY